MSLEDDISSSIKLHAENRISSLVFVLISCIFFPSDVKYHGATIQGPSGNRQNHAAHSSIFPNLVDGIKALLVGTHFHVACLNSTVVLPKSINGIDKSIENIRGELLDLLRQASKKAISMDVHFEIFKEVLNKLELKVEQIGKKNGIGNKDGIEKLYIDALLDCIGQYGQKESFKSFLEGHFLLHLNKADLDAIDDFNAAQLMRTVISSAELFEVYKNSNRDYIYLLNTLLDIADDETVREYFEAYSKHLGRSRKDSKDYQRVFDTLTNLVKAIKEFDDKAKDNMLLVNLKDCYFEWVLLLSECNYDVHVTCMFKWIRTTKTTMEYFKDLTLDDPEPKGVAQSRASAALRLYCNTHTQAQVAKLLTRNGIKSSQPRISEMLNGKREVPAKLLEIEEFSKLLTIVW